MRTTTLRKPEETAIVETARRVLPAGGFGNVSHDVVVARGKGSRVWDLSGNEYIDYLLGSGPMLVGHSHPEVVAAVQAQVAEGMTFFANNAAGVQLAEVIVEAVACAEKVRFVSTGSEADLYAMRVARAYRKRDKILKFEGGYHGMSDFSLMSLAPKRTANFPQAIPDSAGVPKNIADDMLIAPFNDLEVVKSLVREHRDELAGIIVEPCQRLIPPKPGFLEGLRKIADDDGLVLIFDEVVTGFRYAYGGAQAYYGVTPDLCTLGKAIGGGFPLAAIAGRADIMAHFDKDAVAEENFVMQIGTLSGNPVAAVAGLKTLEILRRPGAYEKMFAIDHTLMDGYRRILAEVGVQAQVTGEPPMFDLVFGESEVVDYRSSLGDPAKNKRLHRLMLERGVLKSENKHYVSLAHDERDVAETLAVFEESIKIMREEGGRQGSR
jgi:glutamate-1-semialdehyde 2,1-aminomutase